MPFPTTTPNGAGRVILLIEEYHALAVAFRAALRRLSSHAEIRVCDSLVEAQAAAAERGPDLIIIDVDPPHRGVVEFFNQLRIALPATKVLIIAPQSVPELGSGDAPARAFQFIRKPFELVELAATIDRVFASGASDSRAKLGALRDLTLIDLILLEAAGGATTVLRVEAPGGRTGEIHFADGRICHAVVMGQNGMEALQEILAWRNTRYGELDRRTDAPRTIKGVWQSVLLQAWRAVKKLEPPAHEEMPGQTLETRATYAPIGKKVVVVDDTEMLLIFVEEILATTDRSYEILTAKSGLEAIDYINRLLPDLILLDYSLPDITGGEVCRRLLEDQRTARIPVILMSGHVAEMTAASERYENVIATIAKPFLSKSLTDLVERTVTNLPQVAVRSRDRKNKIAKARTDEAQRDRSLRKMARPLEAAPSVAAPSGEESEEPLSVSLTAESLPSLSGSPQVAATEKSFLEAQPRIPAAKEKKPLQYREFGFATSQISGSAPASFSQIAPAALQEARYNAVVLHLALEVVSLQFSPSLRMTSIRARPASQLVSLHILPQAIPGAVISEAGFQIARVDLDSRGQMHVVHLAPAHGDLPRLETENKIPVKNIVVLPSVRGQAVELTPMPAAPMRMQLLALFELCGVELAPDFGVAHLVLKSRGGKMRVTFEPDAARSGATFQTAQVLLDRSGRMTEVLLDTLL